MILPQEIPRHRQEREQRSITHKERKHTMQENWRRPLLNKPWYKEKKKDQSRAHNSKCQEKSWSKKKSRTRLQRDEKRRRNSSKGREKKNKTKQTKEQKPKYRKENLQNAEKFLGFREGLFFFRGYVLNCEIERKRHPRGHAREPQAEESPGNE